MTRDDLNRIAQAAGRVGASLTDIAEVATLDTLAELLIEARAQGREHDQPGAEDDLRLQGWRSLEEMLAETVAQRREAMEEVVQAWATIEGLAGGVRRAA